MRLLYINYNGKLFHIHRSIIYAISEGHLILIVVALCSFNSINLCDGEHTQFIIILTQR